MKTLCKSICLIIIISAVFMTMACGSVSIPDIFSDNMVLQQKSEITFWGWSNAGETISIKADWMDKEVTLVTGNQGKWNTVIMTPAAGGPFNIHIRGSNEIILKNILIGEVWLCSGQSNMEFSAMSGINNRDEEIKNASYPEIRLFSVYHGSSRYPQDHLKGEWSACTPETMRYFSAVGYFFARKLHKELGIPVGIINSSWGGTPAETWMPEEVIQNNDMLREAASKLIPVRWGPVEPGRLYNFMISPLIPFRIAGVLWYQGESNATNAYAYKDILSELIGSWRKSGVMIFHFILPR